LAGFLDGFVALDLTDLKGQLCGRLLRDLGMEMIKVEPPGGDAVRRLGPFGADEPNLEGSLRFAFLNAGKQSLTLDLHSAEGRDILLRLVEQVDVVLESFAPGTLEALGLGPAQLTERNPNLVITSISGFGQTGSHRDYLCPDIVGFAMGGLMYISGDPALPPVKAPETQAYYFACVHGAYATLLALWQRAKERRGATVDISIQEAMATHEQLIRAAALDGKSIVRHGSQHEYVVPANIFPTQDGAVYLFVVRQHWRKLLEAWPEHPIELEEPELELNHVRLAKADWINGLVREYTRQHTSVAFVQLMQQHGIPCMPVNRPSEFAQDEQIRFRQLFQKTTHAVLGEYEQIAFPVLVDGQRPPVYPPPLVGEHTAAILAQRIGVQDGT
jgi:crotonobetainyl-CoA:carnitine CoA-transferase CaiB-like acyl-CoA transferase